MWVQFVLHHAPGARRLAFLRKLPLLKGLSDNALLAVGQRVTEQVFEVRASHPKSNKEDAFLSTPSLLFFFKLMPFKHEMSKGFDLKL